MARRPKPVHQLPSAQFDAMFGDEDACKAYLTARRWPAGVHCPRCGNPEVYDLSPASGTGSADSARREVPGLSVFHHRRDYLREHE